MAAKKDTAAMFAKLAGEVIPGNNPPSKDEPISEAEPPSKDEPLLEDEPVSEAPPHSGMLVTKTRRFTPGKKGRPPGKRSDPSYTQIGAYIPKDLDKAVKRLLVDEDNVDLSELIAKLLEDWVKRKSR